MADNYTDTAVLLEMPIEAARYAVALADAIYDDDADNIEDERLRADVEILLEDDIQSTSATWEASEHAVTKAGQLYIASDESIDMEATAAVLQATMARFDLPGALAIEWAETCSKKRPGEFGGGAVVITKDAEHWMSTSQWISEKVLELTKASE